MVRPDNPFVDEPGIEDVIRRALAEPTPRSALAPANPPVPFDQAWDAGRWGAPAAAAARPPRPDLAGFGPAQEGGFDFSPAPPAAFGPGRSPLGAGGERPDPLDFGAGPESFQPRRGGSLGLFPGDAFSPTGLRRGEGTTAEQAFELAAINPLVGVASSLLWLAARLNESVPVEDVGALRSRVVDEMSRFEAAAMARGVPARLGRIARYALCAAIDDIVLNTEWGRLTEWPGKSLVGFFYQETWGGERFFDLLGQLHQQPEDNIDALELMAMCLSIGFVGKYRVMDGGEAELARLRTQLYRTIRNVRGPQDWSLATAFETVVAPYRPPARMIWFWLASAAALLLLLLFYAYLGMTLEARIEATGKRVAAVVPAVPVLIDVPVVPSVPDPVAPAPDPAAAAAAAPGAGLTQIQRISAMLQAEIADGSVEVARDGTDIVIRLLRASFATGGNRLDDAQLPTLRKIASALNPEPGPITVVGHTDNVRIAKSTPQRNNDTLSRDRAAVAAGMLGGFLNDPFRISSIGRGAADPIAPNDTPEGRARNRRVEFRIEAERTPL